MNNNLNQQQKLDKLKVIREYQSESKWVEIFELTEKILLNENSITKSNRIFWYYQAIALDVLARPSEALVIFKQLVEQYPLHFRYNNSLSIVCSNLCRRAVDKFTDDLANPDIEIYVKKALETDFCSWQLMSLYIDHLLLTNQTKKAKKHSMNYVELAPYDVQFLSKALDVAFKTKDSGLIKKLLDNVQQGLLEQPYNEALNNILNLYMDGANTTMVS